MDMDAMKKRAEDLLENTNHFPEELTWEDVKTLVHDLRVHQIELELQNEELRNTQKALHDATARYTNLYQDAPVGYLTVDRFGRILQANKTLGEMVQIENSRLLQTSLFDLIDGTDREEFISRFKAFHKRPADKNMEVRLKRGKSSTFYANLEGRVPANPVFQDAVHEADLLLLTINDVSHKKDAELQIEEQRLALKTILDGVQDIVALQYPDHTIISYNKAGYDSLGKSPGQVIGRKCFELIGRNCPCSECATSVALQSGRPETIEKFVPELGKWFQVTAIPVFDHQNRISMIVEQLQDIDDRKRAEEIRNRLENDLRHAQKMEAVGTLAGGIAHDFNNLLQAISGYSQLLLLNKLPTDQDVPQLKQIEAACDRAAHLIRQLLLFSRKVESDRRPVDLNAALVQTRKLLERTLPKMIEIELRLEKNIEKVNADAVQIEQMLLNLGTNAADAMPEGGRLIFQTQNQTVDKEFIQNNPNALPGKYVILTVSDTGHGMEQETIKKIFDPFFTTKEVGKGTGLGLASVYGVVKSQNGYVTCTSAVGKGTTFTILLPAMLPSICILPDQIELKPKIG